MDMTHGGEREERSCPELIGLLPAGGKATRISPLPCSKEIYPVGFCPSDHGRSVRPKVAIHYLLEKIRVAGASKAYIVLREGKWDIPAYLNAGKMPDMHLAYLMMEQPFGVPFTLNRAYPFVNRARIAFGFPDILFSPKDAFARLLARQGESRADLVLGLFEAHQAHRMDMVHLDAEGQVREIQIKPQRTDLKYTWIIAVWSPSFTHFMHEYVEDWLRSSDRGESGREPSQQPEVFVGHVIQAALHKRMKVDTVLFEEGDYLDIGTPEDLLKAVQSPPGLEDADGHC